ncbi:unnamed protein product, partial [Ixodes hexagonus]
KVESPERKEPGVDSCWHVAALAFLTVFLVTVAISNSGFFYVGFMKEFDVNREAASWPSNVITALSHLSGTQATDNLSRPLRKRKRLQNSKFHSRSKTFSETAFYCIISLCLVFYVVPGLGIGITTMALSILLAMYFDKYRGLTSGIKYAGLSYYIGVEWISTSYGISGLILLPITFCNPSIIG